MNLDIPKTDISEFHERKSAYALLIGVFNEGDKISNQIAALQSYRHFVDIIIIDGGSSDGATAPEVLREKVRALLINRDEQRGLSVQYRAGLHYALTQGYSGILMMDGNGKDGPDAIPLFIKRLKEGYDFVQGSRFLPGGNHENTPLDRLFGIRCIFNPVMNFASGFHYTDAINGFKAVSPRLLQDPRVQPFRRIFVRYNLQYFLNFIAPRLGFKTAEIPVSRVYKKTALPQSKIIGIGARAKIIVEMLSTVAGKYNP